MKFTRTAYTGATLRSVLAELVNACDLKDLPFHNGDLHARRHSEEHPDEVRITITVERVTGAAKPDVPSGLASDEAAIAMTLVGEHALLLLRALQAGVAKLNSTNSVVLVDGSKPVFAIMLNGDQPRILSAKCVKALRNALNPRPVKNTFGYDPTKPAPVLR